jgi:hypothetical protein
MDRKFRVQQMLVQYEDDVRHVSDLMCRY